MSLVGNDIRPGGKHVAGGGSLEYGTTTVAIERAFKAPGARLDKAAGRSPRECIAVRIGIDNWYP